MTTFKRKPLYDLARRFSHQITKTRITVFNFSVYNIYYYIDGHNVNTVKTKINEKRHNFRYLMK